MTLQIFVGIFSDSGVVAYLVSTEVQKYEVSGMGKLTFKYLLHESAKMSHNRGASSSVNESYLKYLRMSVLIV